MQIKCLAQTLQTQNGRSRSRNVYSTEVCYGRTIVRSIIREVTNELLKHKLLVTSNFSFSHNVFHRYISVLRQNAALYGNGSSCFTACIPAAWISAAWRGFRISIKIVIRKALSLSLYNLML